MKRFAIFSSRERTRRVRCHGLDEGVEGEGFGEEVGRAVPERLLDEGVRAELRHHYDGGGRRIQGGKHTEAVYLGHDDVEEQEVGRELFDERERFRAVCGDADHFVILPGGKELFEVAGESGVVVGDDH